MPLYAATIFLGAFLLFVAEPLVAKMLLPLFGGSAAVWVAALLFFQTALLAGYAYADVLARKLKPRAAAAVHIGVLAVGLLSLPLAPAPKVAQLAAPLGPTAQVLLVLAAAIGLPYLALSATGPLVQAFWARASGGSPYRLYALSNLGSMLGLLAYPAVIEPFSGLRVQGVAWSVGFVAFGGLMGVLAWRASAAGVDSPRGESGVRPELMSEGSLTNGATGELVSEGSLTNSAPPDAPPTARDRLYWLVLPALSAVLLSAVTVDLTLNVAPIPLLWVLPLAAYLLSFILCFESDRIYRRRAFVPALVGALAFLAWRARSPLRGEHVFFEIGASLAAFFICAMVLHGEVVQKKPAPRHLTRFYLHIALGGALGGGFVAVGAPLLFRSDLELAIGLLATAVAIASLLWSAKPSIGWFPVRRVMRAALVLGVLLLAVQLAVGEAWIRKVAVAYVRGFYGPMRIQDEPAADEGTMRKLIHGATVHGTQRLAEGRGGEATGYYGPKTGIALALAASAREARPLRVGVIGLGAGVLATYCRPGDRYTFFEIDPLVEQVARTHFKFLDRCPGAEVVLGDARLTMAARPPQAYDVLILDAFSGDAVPVHLLTAEAFDLYARHLAPGALMSLHVSNRFLDLVPVVAAGAERIGRSAYLVEDAGDPAKELYGTRWTVVAESPAQLMKLGLAVPNMKLVERPRTFAPWTDDRSNLATLLR